ncbi:phosphonate C-P lyase system protein PhnL [Tritonibacter horizontis]|uniref:Alpha-D-ribose 1-methylphosphonate 5-triphosphate synthase subunit PhnL n=1 Tax=Tritonibacter horizontis TaxID=1768241 RepID=A0A132BX79_9RHOB|nr:ATP-binding cassette domain-containing protein [Tritonibacter horizontis]KUP92968.1 alpha-D-ribose 1-methylphosphonate 5-triphosphate synthase subunit PhnL [Tritonibacter horizontis]
MSLILDVRALSKGFTMHHLGTRVDAFHDVSFVLQAGEFLLLKGRNGAGKSTLLRTLYRSYLAASGQILFHSSHGEIDLVRAADVDVTFLRRTEIGFVTQFLVARPRVSAEALVAEPLQRAGRAPAEALDEARHWLQAFGVKRDLWPAYPTTFSGGEQQKVNLARALILPQRLLLLDEPTASLDASARAALIDRLADLKSQGTAMIGVFHHPGDVAALIDREIDLTPDQIPEQTQNMAEDMERTDVVV